MINEEKFKKYVLIQQSGLVNMNVLKNVVDQSGLTTEECLDIINNYEKYSEEFKKVFNK